MLSKELEMLQETFSPAIMSSCARGEAFRVSGPTMEFGSFECSQ